MALGTPALSNNTSVTITSGTVTANQGNPPWSVNLTQVGGSPFTLGQQLAASSLPVVLTASQLSTLTPPAAITNYALETGGNLATLAGTVSASRVNVNVTNATLAVTQSGAPWSENITQINSHAIAESGLSGSLAIGGGAANGANISAGTNPVMIGGSDFGGTPKVEIARVDTSGNQYVIINGDVGSRTYDGEGGHVIATHGKDTSGTTVLATAILGEYDDVSPTTVTENQFANLRMSSNRNLYNTIRDAAGNERGANVTASNELLVNVNNTVTVGTHAVTQSGSWTVTANAGTNLNTSLLALESGGNLATLAGGVSASIYQSNIKQINGATPLMGAGNGGTGSLRVNIASDQVSIPVAATLTAETTKVIGTVNQGTSPWVANATLQTQTDTVMVGGVNIKEINAVTPLMGNGTTGTGSLRVTIASDNTAFAVNATLSAETTKVIGTVNPALIASAIVGQKKITASAVQLGSNVLTNGVIFTALSTNTGNIFIGGSSVNTTADGTGNGYILEPGSSISFAATNTNLYYVIGTANDVLSFVGS